MSESNLIGYATVGIGVRSGRVLDAEVHDELSEAQEELHRLMESPQQNRIRWAIVKMIEMPGQ